MDNQTVDSTKIWTIKFSKNVLFNDTTKKAITVKDSSGNLADVTLSLGDSLDTIKILPPDEGYNPGKSYTITVGQQVLSAQNKNIVKERKLNFTIKQNSSYINKDWGLGTNQTEYISNNRNYDWYIDQGFTGTYSGDNCGPSSVTMACKWYNSTFNKTAEDARNTYRSAGGWWYTNDITNYLDDNNIPNETLSSSGQSSLIAQLKQGNILILCIDTTYLKFNSYPEQRVGRFYDFQGGHFLVVKGYRVVDGTTYFETYDPNNWGAEYEDSSPKGKDRYYEASQLVASMDNWWNYMIVVTNKPLADKTITKFSKLNIPEASGK